MTDEDKEMLDECQQWKNSLNIRIGFPKEFVDKFKTLSPEKEIKKFRIVGLIDRDRWNMYEGYRKEGESYHHCLFRIYHPKQMNEVKNEIITYSKIQKDKNKAKEKKKFNESYQKLISIGFSEESQTFVFCLEYCYLMNFSDFNYALHLLPENAKNMIILKIALSLDKTLEYMHKKLKIVHRKISAETVIFNLDSKPIITDFSNVLFIESNNNNNNNNNNIEGIIKDMRDLGELIKSIRDFKIKKLKAEIDDDDEKDDDDESEEDEEEDEENNKKKKNEEKEKQIKKMKKKQEKENEEKAKKQKIDDQPKDEIADEIDKFITEHINYEYNKDEESQYYSDTAV